LRILIAILENSEEPDHRWRAARALGGRGDANGLYALLRSLAEDHDSDVRRIAADAIAQMSSIIEIATPLLSPVLDLLVVEKDPLVRRHMCEILRNLPGSEQRISSFVLDASNPSEECRALEALYWLNATGQQWIFIKGLKSNKDEGVRVVCASALRNAADGDARKVLSKTALEDRSEYVRATSIEALLPEEIERCADDLLTIISDESRLSLRIAACKALSRIRHSQLASILKPIIHDPTAEEEFRETALELIWSNRLGDVVEVAVHILLNDSAWRVRAMAAYLLRDARDSKALSALSTAIQYDLHLTVRAWAIESLRLKGDRAAWDVIEKCALSDTSDLVRWRAIESMRFSTFDSAVDVLRQIIVNDKEKPNLREIAIRTVSAMQCPMSMLDSFKTLITNTELRDCAFEAICRLERKTSLPHLP
jgi:HEAT repeat protein